MVYYADRVEIVYIQPREDDMCYWRGILQLAREGVLDNT